LQYDTMYTWFVNATDPSGSGEYTRAVYTFTTEISSGGDDDDDSSGSVGIPKFQLLFDLILQLFSGEITLRAFFPTLFEIISQ